MIRFENKDGKPIQIGYLHSEMVRALNTIAIWSARQAKTVRITSANDRGHSDNSLHYEDLAFDFMVDGDEAIKFTAILVRFLEVNLGPGYDIVWNVPGHYTHAHVEFDARQR